jgi:hypothetical protein
MKVHFVLCEQNTQEKCMVQGVSATMLHSGKDRTDLSTISASQGGKNEDNTILGHGTV